MVKMLASCKSIQMEIKGIDKELQKMDELLVDYFLADDVKYNETIKKCQELEEQKLELVGYLKLAEKTINRKLEKLEEVVATTFLVNDSKYYQAMKEIYQYEEYLEELSSFLQTL